MQVPLLKFEAVTFRKFQYNVFTDTNWEMHYGETWAITGVNGSGKTTFLEAVEGRLIKLKGQVEYHITDVDGNVVTDPHQHIVSVYFNDHSINYNDFYYQQRYHATETDGVITVKRFLNLDAGTIFPDLLQDLGISELLDMEMIKLSNGQFKKMMIAKALLKRPLLLLLDNLYTGLDKWAQAYISDTIERISKSGTQIIMTSGNSHIPDTVSHVMEVDHFTIQQIVPRQNYSIHHVAGQTHTIPLLPQAPGKTFDIVVYMNQATITYNDKIIIDHVDWTVRHGEKWALMGPNGAGKSMLLSLIFADNPQAYANNIILFDRKRGSGESIWDIKDRIGFVSPEMHIYFHQNKTCREIAMSGLHENPYKRTVITENISRMVDDLFDYFSIAHQSNTLFQKVSTGQQNIVLFIRALVKNPPVLILDEPFQGVDLQIIKLAKQLLDNYCRERTLIFVSHNSEELPICIRHCFYIENGRAIQNLIT